ncbi:MAG: hypothetical protein ACRD2F_03200, partial [Terriglobales bacterium]
PNMTFPPYSATLVVLTGQGTPVAAEWSLDPSLAPAATGPGWLPPPVVMVSAGGTVDLPLTTSGSGTVTLTGVTADAPLKAQIVAGPPQEVALSVPATATPGFYQFQVTAKDSSGVVTTQTGTVEVGLPVATMTAGNDQSAAAGSAVTLSVTVSPGSSGATPAGLDVLFHITSGGGSLAAAGGTQAVAVNAAGTAILMPTDSSGTASVTLTLPASAGTVAVEAEGQYAIGHPVQLFEEIAH